MIVLFAHRAVQGDHITLREKLGQLYIARTQCNRIGIGIRIKTEDLHTEPLQNAHGCHPDFA
ncbi:Uncharacterised protein [Vibrio cholerae]|uniref:Uncharacterized protein n=1 Tax=Vibrio cholerae TaxID=666 RepID=A0A655V4J6_VIBCL|nr:Uncharacterised protein [Vibrio cholerae]CSB61888.1 Uncharacterised protein [Vibrio cholerae]CSB75906.1 Uncharacterised protein [Vibrio cholerae]CSB83520.1 Uncharacterised protein [Vibrio cholerae]CSC02653.1 Uncharacterised protein [Vibrio cholerae]